VKEAYMGEGSYRPDLVSTKSERLILLSGCSGGGKSSLLAELGRRGHAIYEEPGRQVVKEELLIGGDALPWQDWRRFLDLTISRSIYNMTMAARCGGVAFFDRGIIDQIAGLRAIGEPVPPSYRAAAEKLRCAEQVFVLPPWPEIFVCDAERRHGFDEAAAKYPHLISAYEAFGYRCVTVPKISVAARADFILDRLGRLAVGPDTAATGPSADRRCRSSDPTSSLCSRR
jgi:predicted ATPase